MTPSFSHPNLDKIDRERLLDLVLGHERAHLGAFDSKGIIFLSEGKGLVLRDLSQSDLVGRSVFDLGHDSPQNLDFFRRALNGEEFMAIGGLEGGTYEGYFVPKKDPSGAVTEVWLLTINVTEREKFAREKNFLIEASKSLAESLDYETTLEKVARLALGVMADYCIIDLLNDDNNLRQVASAHIEPRKEDLAHALQRRYIKHQNSEYGTYKVAHSGKCLIYPDITDDMLVAAAADEDELDLFRRLNPVSCIIAPLTARGRTLGAISFWRSDSGLHYTNDDIHLAEEVARRAAIAVDNALLYKAATEGRSQRSSQ